MALCGVSGLVMEFGAYTRPLDDGGTTAMFVSALVTAIFAAVVWQIGLSAPRNRGLSRRDATLAVALIWAGAGVFGGIPFMLGAGFGPADAFFEAISGFTTTGATIVQDIEGTLSRPLLLWRSLIQWLGGMGIVVLFVAVFPNVGVGGKHMFRSEVPGPTAEGLQPRIAETSITLWLLYFAFTVVLIGVLFAIGVAAPAGVPHMDLFESICHALTTMSTGGFSTRNDSIAAFQSPLVEGTLSAFMLLAGVNFGLYYGAIRGRSVRVFVRSTEFRVYVTIVLVTIAALTLATLDRHPDPFQALRYALFMVATTITSTGFGTDDYMAYASPALTIVLLLMFLGGMSGSTAGGIKVSRIVLLARTSWAQIRRTVRPSVVQTIRMSGKPVPSPVLAEVTVFFFVYMAFMGAGTLAVTILDGVSVQAAFGAMLTCLSNMGPAPFHEGPDNFVAYSGGAKTLFACAMILGRLEFFTLLALLLPDFWRR